MCLTKSLEKCDFQGINLSLHQTGHFEFCIVLNFSPFMWSQNKIHQLTDTIATMTDTTDCAVFPF